MKSPEGQEMPNQGAYLEVAPNEKLVFTDAFTSAWSPKEGQPFMVVILTFEEEPGKTRYTARVWHWPPEAKTQHEAMGFHQGWRAAASKALSPLKTGGAYGFDPKFSS